MEQSILVDGNASQNQELKSNRSPNMKQEVLVDEDDIQKQDKPTEASTDTDPSLSTEKDVLVDGDASQKQECKIGHEVLVDRNTNLKQDSTINQELSDNIIGNPKEEASTKTPSDVNLGTPPNIKQDVPVDTSTSQKEEPRMEQSGFIDGSFIQEQEEPHFIPPPNMVTIIVGLEDHQKHFCVHKELICYHSPWFFKAIHGLLAAGDQKIMIDHKTLILDDVDPNVFTCLFQWLYTKEVMVVEESDSDSIRLDTLKTLAQLWLLGQTLKMPRFQDNVLEALESKIKAEVNVACQFWAWLYDLEETKGILMMRIIVTFRLFLCWPAVDPEFKGTLPEGYPLHFEEMAQAFSAFERNDEFDEYMRSFCFQVVRRECGNILSLM